MIFCCFKSSKEGKKEIFLVSEIKIVFFGYGNNEVKMDFESEDMLDDMLLLAAETHFIFLFSRSQETRLFSVAQCQVTLH